MATGSGRKHNFELIRLYRALEEHNALLADQQGLPPASPQPRVPPLSDRADRSPRALIEENRRHTRIEENLPLLYTESSEEFMGNPEDPLGPALDTVFGSWIQEALSDRPAVLRSFSRTILLLHHFPVRGISNYFVGFMKKLPPEVPFPPLRPMSLSASGMRLPTSRPHQMGETLSITLFLPTDPAPPIHLYAEAVRPSEIFRKGGYETRISFAAINPRDQERILQAIAVSQRQRLLGKTYGAR